MLAATADPPGFARVNDPRSDRRSNPDGVKMVQRLAGAFGNWRAAVGDDENYVYAIAL
jgi:hypothetical protein